jgi:hypothetical protein
VDNENNESGTIEDMMQEKAVHIYVPKSVRDRISAISGLTQKRKFRVAAEIMILGANAYVNSINNKQAPIQTK